MNALAIEQGALRQRPLLPRRTVTEMVSVTVTVVVIRAVVIYSSAVCQQSMSNSHPSSSPTPTELTCGSTTARPLATSHSTPSPAARGRNTASNRRRSPQLRKDTYDHTERVKDMSTNGVLGSLCFPSFPQFCGQLFARTADKDVALAMVRAYNDWHIDEWCGSHPGRLIPCALPAIWDPETLAVEIHRSAKHHAAQRHSAKHRPNWDGCRSTGTQVGRPAARNP